MTLFSNRWPMRGRFRSVGLRNASYLRTCVEMSYWLASVLSASIAGAANLPVEVQARLGQAVFEVVMAKPVVDSMSYEKPLPLELLSYSERTDKYRSIGTAFCIAPNTYISAAHVFDAGVVTQYGEPALRDGAGNVHAVDQVLKYSSERDFIVFSLKQPIPGQPLQVNRAPVVNTPVFAAGNALAEFKFAPMLFPLLRVLYFNLLDANSNGSLDPSEFPFTLKVPDEFFVMNADGTGWNSLFLFEGHPACGSPAVSPDGKQIAFDASPLKQQGNSSLFVMSIDGGNPRQIETGMMPTWSKDRDQLACSRGSPKYGVWLMELEGADHQFLAQGWGAQFSPDGSQIAFAEGTALKVYDLNTRETRTVLDGEANPYQQIYWNSTWSPDGKRLCFKGIKADGTQEVATVQMAGDKPELKVHHSGKLAINGDFAWHPLEDRIVFSMTCPERNNRPAPRSCGPVRGFSRPPRCRSPSPNPGRCHRPARAHRRADGPAWAGGCPTCCWRA